MKSSTIKDPAMQQKRHRYNVLTSRRPFSQFVNNFLPENKEKNTGNILNTNGIYCVPHSLLLRKNAPLLA